MFYYIKGLLAHLEPGFAVVDAKGVGYKLTITGTTYEAMPPHLSVATPPEVTLYTYMAIREDAIELFGFASHEELSAFKLLISVSGVGPKAAIAILSLLTPEKFALAVCSEDTKAISKANGVGAKTAARIVLELKDKLQKEMIFPTEAGGVDPLPIAEGKVGGKLSEALDALIVLGYSRAEAMGALRGIDVSAHGLEDIIRLGLKKLMK